MSETRMPAEWERHRAVLMAWPHAGTDWAPMLPEIQHCYQRIINALSRHEEVVLIGPEEPQLPASVTFKKVPINDTWTRDYGPIEVERDGQLVALDFKFNGWGLKFAADKDNMANHHLEDVLGCPIVNRLNFVLEGGSIESDGAGTVMTTESCLLSPNRNGQFDKHQIQEYLKKELGAAQVLWLAHGHIKGDDTDGHIDTLARLAPENTIIFSPSDDPRMVDDLKGFRTLEGRPYKLLELPRPTTIVDDDGEELPATYANYLVTPTVVLVPAYRQPENDAMAACIIASAFPGRAVESLDCVPLIKQHGSLHCATMQLY